MSASEGDPSHRSWAQGPGCCLAERRWISGFSPLHRVPTTKLIALPEWCRVSWGCRRQRGPRGGGTDSHITAQSEAGVRPHGGPGPLRPDTAATAVPEGHRKDGVLVGATPSESPPPAWLKLGRREGILGDGEGSLHQR